MDFFANIGFFVYPLLLCSILVVFISCERLYSLRKSATISEEFLSDLLENGNNIQDTSVKSLAGRVLVFFNKNEYAKDENLLKAFIQIEVSRLEKGLFILESITAIAPLMGLLGTVFGLTDVFGELSFSLSAQPSNFISGIALALNTTIFGLIIAIPAFIMHFVLTRKIELISKNLNLCIESLLFKDR